MNDPDMFCVHIVADNDTYTTDYFKALDNISRQIDDDAFLLGYKPNIFFILLRPKVCPSRMAPQMSSTFSGNVLYYKNAQGISKVPGAVQINLNKHLNNYYNVSEHRIRRICFDVARNQFINTEHQTLHRSKVRLSTRIQHVDSLVSLKEEYNRHDEAYRPSKNKNAKRRQPAGLRGYVQSKFSSHHIQEPARALPLDRVDNALPLRQKYPVQATDGPYENVDLLSPLVRRLTLEEQGPVSSRQRQPCRHPDYANEDARRRSYGSWPLQHDVQNVDQLVNYGFFYTGYADIVRCFQCGLGLKDWSHVEDPLQEHVRFSPYCLHLADTMAGEELDQYRSATSGLRNAAEPNGIPYRHPEYKNEATRIQTFTKWPTTLVQTPELLAQAGFYYTGLQDQVRCYACDGGLQHWDVPDEPWTEHARWFPHCRHVLSVKGEGFVNMIQLALADTEEEPDTDTDLGAGIDANGAGAGRLESDDPVYSQEAQNVIINFGFSKAAVKMAIQECFEKKIRWNSNILADLLYDKQARGEVLPVDSPRPESPVLPQVDVSTEEGMTAENKRLLNRMRCIMCEVNETNVLFLPCAHHKMCMTCADDVTMCPICRKTVTQKVKTFMA